ncbi:MAG: tRNA preQ1(34) S-adenosylmethionine ribosyltransferase-isomerase QueA [Hyphomicrobiales bacterium]
MRVDLFNFDLPDEAIALRPARPRDSAKMLGINPHSDIPVSDHGVMDLPTFLREGDALVFNDTKVIPAQLSGIRRRGEPKGAIEAKIDLTLHLRSAPHQWKAFARPAKKLQTGDTLHFGNLMAEVMEKGDAGEVILNFDCKDAALDEAIALVGHVPLPPYISGKRGEDEHDLEDYQTIYASKPGAVAAPTAGLHTTERLLDAAKSKGVSLHYLTLHVGAGTFLPVKVDDTETHKMHAEIGVVSEETARALNDVRAQGGRIIAVGTTSLRLLESATNEQGIVQPFAGETDIFITPGYKFRAVDMLMTNFHLPKSTLFMLVSAFCGIDLMKAAYDHAIQTGYRFYSYGDASLLWRADLNEELR